MLNHDFDFNRHLKTIKIFNKRSSTLNMSFQKNALRLYFWIQIDSKNSSLFVVVAILFHR